MPGSKSSPTRRPTGPQQQRPRTLFHFLVVLLVIQFFINSIHHDSTTAKRHRKDNDTWKRVALPSSFSKRSSSKKNNKNDVLGASITQLHRWIEAMGNSNNRDHLPPPVKSKWGKVVYNPQAFNNHHEIYVNKPLPCKGVCVPPGDKKQRKRSLPPPGRIVQAANRTTFHNNHKFDVVITHLFRWSHGASLSLRRFVGSLRRTGYTGAIIVGLREAGAEPSDWTFLAEHQVTVYAIETEACGTSTTEECWKGSSTTDNPEWGWYEMHASWLEAVCASPTKCGRVLSAMDMATVYFQANPFAHMSVSEPTTLVLAEDLAPHTDPVPYSTTTEIRRHQTWAERRGGTSLTCLPQMFKLRDEQRPVLVTSVVLGTAASLQRFFATTIEYLRLLQDSGGACRQVDTQQVINYVYYTGLLEGTPMPWGTGPILSLGRACNNRNIKGSTSSGQIDLIDVDVEHTGYLFNVHAATDDTFRVPAILVDTTTCTKWMRRYFELHERLGTTVSNSTRTTPIGPLLRRAIHWELTEQRTNQKAKPPPMKTAYHRATVVQRAAWFDRTGYCLQTCCAQPIAVSLEQDADHLITSVDGLDLADVVLLGHDIKNHLVLDVSYMDAAIVPCLREGTIFYADSEAGGIIRFYEQFRPNLTKPFVMITGRTDGPEPITGRDIGIKAIQTDQLLTRWYGINPCYECGAKSDKFAMMHLGLSAAFDHQRYLYDYVAARNFVNPFSGANKAKFLDSPELRNANDVTNLLFVKFGINERSQHRQAPFDMACQNRTDTPKDFISCSTNEHKFHPSDIYSTAETYLFGLSPPGNGNDCYRTYELLYLGVIPVVKYSPEFEELFKDIPILMLRNWKLTQQELVAEMRRYIYSPEFRDNDFLGWDRLFLKYWRHKVLSDAGRLDEIVEDDMGRPYYQAWTYHPYTPPLEYKGE